MGMALHGLGRRAAALAALDRALALDGAMVVVPGNRGHILADMGRWSEARAAFRQAVAAAPEVAAGWRNHGAACHHADALVESEAACRRAMLLDPPDIGTIIQLATTLERAGRAGEARLLYAEAAHHRAVVVEPCLGGPPQARVLIICGRGAANVPTEILFDRRRFETITLNLAPPGTDGPALAELVAGLPPYDVAFSALGDGRADDPFVAQGTALAQLLDRPLLNPPARIPPTCREALPTLLAGIPGLVVPATGRMTRAEVEQASRAGGLAWPLLIRPIGSHGGEGLCKTASPAELAAYLGRVSFESFHVTGFVDYASGDGYYRKYRFIFVDRRVYAYHLVIHTDWLVHYFRAEMDRDAWRRREEELFLADYRQVFAGDAAEAVAEAARRLDLDYGGMDCALTRDGRVLVFEANACMLVHLHDSPEDFAYKHQHVPRIVEAVGRMVLARATPPG